MVRVELESTVLARGLVCAELPARKVCTRSNQGFGVSRSQKVSLCPGYELQSLVLHYFMTLLAFLFVYYGWMNSKANAEGRKCSGHLCYEAERPAACMTLCLPNTLVKARAGMRAWEVAEWRAQSLLAMFINQSEILCPVAVFPSHCVYPSAQNETCCVLVEKEPSISFEVSFGRSEIQKCLWNQT